MRPKVARQKRLNRSRLDRAVAALADRDADLAAIAAEFGPPPLWERAQGFPTLIHIILEQQVSLASARAAFARLESLVETVTPGNFLALSDAQLRAAGFSRQKSAYGRELADSVIDGRLNLESLDALSDHDARHALTRVRGIGPWTADIYLLMAVGRQDVWPNGDLALEIAMQQIKGLEKRPAPAEASQISEQWRPWRAVAARMLWQFYLQRPSKRPDD